MERIVPAHLARLAVLTLVTLGCGVSPAVEQEAGDAMAAQVIRESPVFADTALDAWLDALGARIVAVADSQQGPWNFTVIDRDDLNAFAIPGGHVFVHRGLLAAAGTMSEVAGVVGHEVAHVTLRHSARQLGKRTRTGVVLGIFCTVTGWCAGDVAQVALELGGAAWMARHSRADEAQSDSAAIEYLVRAGIDPGGVTRMFERMAAERSSTPGALEAFFSSHPLDDERVRATRAQVGRARLGPALQGDDSVFLRVRPPRGPG
ncbi:MAG: M48 family metalloprotease [Gemmatimonadetes bacterium]|nr:M48 family metalloprotease [Gemmatimonadota bacterium]